MGSLGQERWHRISMPVSLPSFSAVSTQFRDVYGGKELKRRCNKLTRFREKWRHAPQFDHGTRNEVLLVFYSPPYGHKSIPTTDTDTRRHKLHVNSPGFAYPSSFYTRRPIKKLSSILNWSIASHKYAPPTEQKI